MKARYFMYTTLIDVGYKMTPVYRCYNGRWQNSYPDENKWYAIRSEDIDKLRNDDLNEVTEKEAFLHLL